MRGASIIPFGYVELEMFIKKQVKWAVTYMNLEFRG